MLSKAVSFDLCGLTGFQVGVETDIASGQVGVGIVGLGDAAVREAKSRVRSAVENSGYRFPHARVTVSLSPADVKKEGSKFDLAMALGILAACGEFPASALEGWAVLGELALSGGVRGVSGVLPVLIAAAGRGISRVILPAENAAEAGYAANVSAYPVKTLSECVEFLRGERRIDPVAPQSFDAKRSAGPDLKYVKGQSAARRALEIAVSGGHNLLMIGPPGAGKTMLAKCVPGILPPLDFDEALEVTKIHSVAGILGETGIVSGRPFRTPHHTASAVALTGGGRDSRPGEISLAHRGVLFLDELPEYSRQALETLRQPLEDGVISIARAGSRAEYPADFLLVASMNPCPCGNYGSASAGCSCSPAEIRSYLKRLSAPLLDRIDLHVEVDSVKYDELHGGEGECSEAVRLRVLRAREIQRERYRGRPYLTNDGLDGEGLKEFCALDGEGEKLLAAAFARLNLSARGYTRILKVARTVADMEESRRIRPGHVAEAAQYRALDRKFWEG